MLQGGKSTALLYRPKRTGPLISAAPTRICPVIEAKDIYKSFKAVAAVRGVSFSAIDGQITGQILVGAALIRGPVRLGR